jgi:hypothetical protein
MADEVIITPSQESSAGIASLIVDEIFKKLSGGAVDTIATVFGDKFAKAAIDSMKNVSLPVSDQNETNNYKNPVSSGQSNNLSKKPNIEKANDFIEQSMSAELTKNVYLLPESKEFDDKIAELKKEAEVRFGVSFDDKQTSVLMEKIKKIGTSVKAIWKGAFDEPGEPLIKSLADERAIYESANFVANTAKKLSTIAEEHVLKVNRLGTDISTNWLGGPQNSTQSIENVSEVLERYRRQVFDSVKATGLSSDSLHSLAKAFDNAGVNSLGFGKDYGQSSEIVKNSSEFIAESALVIKGAGMSFDEGGRQLGFAMRNLGLNQQEAMQSLGIMAEVASSTGESLSVVTSSIQKGREQLKFYGDTTKGVAETYTKLLKTVGEGRADWAAEFLNTIVNGIGNMNAGLAAFIGQASGIGRGQGAIGSMLEVEEKIASGDIQGVLDAVTKQIETISGSSLLTRQEAISTGKQDQFFLQRELLSKFGFGGGGQEQTTRLLENLARGQQVSQEQFSGARGLEQLRDRGEQIVRAEVGPIGMAANLADAAANLAGTERSARIFFDSAAQFNNTVDLLTNQIPELAVILKEKLSAKEELADRVSSDVFEDETPEGQQRDFRSVTDENLGQSQDAGSELNTASAKADAAGNTFSAQIDDRSRIIPEASLNPGNIPSVELSEEIPDSQSNRVMRAIGDLVEKLESRERSDNSKDKEEEKMAQFVLNIQIGSDTITKIVKVNLNQENKNILV